MKIKILLASLAAIVISAHCGATGYKVTDNSLLPKPLERKMESGFFVVGGGTRVEAEVEGLLASDAAELAAYLEATLRNSYGYGWNAGSGHPANRILLKMEKTWLPADGYLLDISDESITITAEDRGGLFYGIVTLMQMLPPQIYYAGHIGEPTTLQCQRIKDYPRFGYRGAMLDVARTFSDKERVKRFIDRMAHHKLNRLHWHLTDDEGWRIELESVPELARVGGFRGGDSPVKAIYGEWDTKYGGYYTKDDVREIVEYAKFRNVEIIPEVELPGHSRAAAKVYPSILCAGPVSTAASGDDRRNVWCAAKEGNYRMLELIIDELVELFPSGYINLGGDEVETGQWSRCPDCQALMRSKGMKQPKELTVHFIERLSEMVRRHGYVPCAWNEVAESGKYSKNSLIYGWEGLKQVLDVTAKGYPTVIMPGSWFYIDMKQAPQEDGLTWAGMVDLERVYSFDFDRLGFKDRNMENVQGVQVAFFSELYLSHDPEYLDYMTYPRICALAELGWTHPKLTDYDDFYRRLTASHLDRLSAMHVFYRLFPPVATYGSGEITVEAPFSGAEVRFTSDGSDPIPDSPLYKGPLKDYDPAKYRFISFYKDYPSAPVSAAARKGAEIAASSSVTVELPLSGIVHGPGQWFVRLVTTDDNLKLERVVVYTDSGMQNIAGSQNVVPFNVLKFNATLASAKGRMVVTVRNPNPYACKFTIELEPSRYIQPKVKFASTISQNERFPFSRIEGYNYSTYSRTNRTCRPGDRFTWIFEQPVDAYSIEVHTGLSYLPRYLVPFGRVQVSSDGVHFTDIAELRSGKATVYPEGRVKAVRVVSDSEGNAENAVALQNLKIVPRR